MKVLISVLSFVEHVDAARAIRSAVSTVADLSVDANTTNDEHLEWGAKKKCKDKKILSSTM